MLLSIKMLSMTLQEDIIGAINMTDILTLEPTSGPSRIDQPAPLLLVLHGNQSSPAQTAPYWRSMTAYGWRVVLPQAPHMQAPATFLWKEPGPDPWPTDYLLSQFDDLRQRYTIDAGSLVLAGFSMGGGFALWLTLQGLLPCQGCIAVAPYVPYEFVDPQQLLPAYATSATSRTYFLVGDQDSFACEGALRVCDRLGGTQSECRVDVIAGIGHVYPPTFDHDLVRALTFLTQGPPKTSPPPSPPHTAL